jgi:hypothetical protein
METLFMKEPGAEGVIEDAHNAKQNIFSRT